MIFGWLGESVLVFCRNNQRIRQVHSSQAGFNLLNKFTVNNSLKIILLILALPRGLVLYSQYVP
jgi:hypothetical protein